MDKIYAFKNPQQFNEIFGIVEQGNGVKSRRNSILLSFYKSKKVWDYCRKNSDLRHGFSLYRRYFAIASMAELKYTLMCDIKEEMINRCHYPVVLMSETFYSNIFSTDECCGIPSNGEVGYVRYVTHQKNRDGKIYKMKSGKFFKKLLLETKLGQALPEQVINWMCEEFTTDWQSYVTRQMPHFTLNVDDDFERIYSYDRSDGCTHDFGSCMMDDGQHLFYRDCVKAKAASLVNDKGKVIARCIIFTEARDEDGKVWRLAERQYAQNGSDLYKRCLVDALIEGGYIDAYKKVGVDCHCNQAYVDINGLPLYTKKFTIDCDLEFSPDDDYAWDNEKNHILSYQDSFRFYDVVKKEAYNFEQQDYNNIRLLDTTCCYLEGYWDEYHEEYCCSVMYVHYKGDSIRCNRNKIEDFVQFNGEFFHKYEMVVCEHCGKQMPDPELYGSFTYSVNGKHVCSRRCYIQMRDEYLKKECYYDNIRCDHIPFSEDKPVKMLFIAFGEINVITGSASQINRYIERNKLIIIHGMPCFKSSATSIETATNVYNNYSNTFKEHTMNMIMEVRNHNQKYGVESLFEELTTI